MIHKRPFMGDGSCELSRSHKYPRQMEHCDHLGTEPEHEDAYGQWQTLGDDVEDTSGGDQDVGSSARDSQSLVEFPNKADKDIKSGAFDRFHQYWQKDGTLDADLSLFPEYFDYGHQLGTLLEPDEIMAPLFSPYPKPVCIGPEYQTFVPDWDFQTSQKHKDNQAACSSSQDVVADCTSEEKLMGTCIIPMPKEELCFGYSFGRTEVDCDCPDRGSIRCVKQHVTEARQKLGDKLGEELFERLGFNGMGEYVAMKWSEDKEQIFNQVVRLNPASLGKNFWDYLPASLPSLRKRDLVSYYFNVFMLRKRAEQNRFDPLNIDSDDDEWQVYETEELGKDEDSDVESPIGQDGPDCYWEGHTSGGNGYVLEDDEDGDFEETFHDNGQGAAYEGDLDDKSASGVPRSKRDGCDSQEDSCTSYEHQQGIGEDVRVGGTTGQQ